MHNLASELHQRSTKSEEILWQMVRNRQLEGRKFRRQVPIGSFVLDFFCAEEKLAIEIDGAIHEQQQAGDKLRQEAIESLGIRFLRFSSEAVENNLSEVLKTITQVFK